MMDKNIIGIDLGGTKLLLRWQDKQEEFNTGLLFTPEQLLSQIESFILRHKLQPKCLGLAVPGLVDSRGRVAECDVLPAFTGWPAKDVIQKLGMQVTVLNDVKAALIEETHALSFGAELTGGVIMVGTAIGAAFITQDKPLLGTSGWAGELGYLPIAYKTGVRRLDEVASGAAIVKACDLTPAKLAAKAREQDANVLLAIKQAGESLGLGLAAVINLLNPSFLFVGGGTNELPGYWQATLASAKQNTLVNLWQDCQLSKVKAGKNVVVLGAIRAATLDCPLAS